MDRNLWTLLDIQNRGNDLNHVKYIRLWGSSHFQKKQPQTCFIQSCRDRRRIEIPQGCPGGCSRSIGDPSGNSRENRHTGANLKTMGFFFVKRPHGNSMETWWLADLDGLDFSGNQWHFCHQKNSSYAAVSSFPSPWATQFRSDDNQRFPSTMIVT